MVECKLMNIPHIKFQQAVEGFMGYVDNYIYGVMETRFLRINKAENQNAHQHSVNVPTSNIGEISETVYDLCYSILK
jgi:hypothetical protein